jgi:hypothetical protein
MRIIILTLILGACGGEAAPVEAPLVSEAPAEAAAEPSAEQEVPVPDEEWEISTDKEIVGPRAKARHILVAYEGAAQAQDSVGRSKNEAALTFQLWPRSTPTEAPPPGAESSGPSAWV